MKNNVCVISLVFGKLLFYSLYLYFLEFMLVNTIHLPMHLPRLQSLFEIGDVVSVMAEKTNKLWSVNNDYGFVARHSDFLVSGTTIVGSLFCSRRSVISDIFKGLDCPSSVMVIGTLIHQLLQTVH